jgi:hypothetical protein
MAEARAPSLISVLLIISQIATQAKALSLWMASKPPTDKTYSSTKEESSKWKST